MTPCPTDPIRCESCPTRLEGIFSTLPRERLRVLDQCKADNLYHKGQVLFEEGDPARGVYCVYEGQVKLCKSGSQGRPQIVGIAKSGTLIGHRAVLTGKSHGFTAESLGDARVCFVERPTFLSLLSSNLSVAESLLKKMALDLDSVEDRLMDIVEKPVPVRLARLLLSLRDSYGRPSRKGTEITLSLTREEMAEMIGTTQETTIRLLSQFRQRGLVRLDHKSITLLDPEKLAQLVEGTLSLE
ncbi:MAG: Crp/Fnr family transcriptional regulator [Elusimicrobia bacterium]|nr:Crp/Fnr family transcriptional regulator [Elusimicrobiota bacterium]